MDEQPKKSAAPIRTQTVSAFSVLNTLHDGQVISGEFTAQQWALSTKDGNKLKIMRMRGIHNFTLCHHLSFGAHFWALYAPCQIKRTFSLIYLNFLWLVCELSAFPPLIMVVWQIKCQPVMSVSWCHHAKNQRQSLTKTSNCFSTRNTFLC